MQFKLLHCFRRKGRLIGNFQIDHITQLQDCPWSAKQTYHQDVLSAKQPLVIHFLCTPHCRFSCFLISEAGGHTGITVSAGTLWNWERGSATYAQRRRAHGHEFCWASLISLIQIDWTRGRRLVDSSIHASYTNSKFAIGDPGLESWLMCMQAGKTFHYNVESWDEGVTVSWSPS